LYYLTSKRRYNVTTQRTSYILTEEDKLRLDKVFRYHCPKEDQLPRYEVIRNEGREFAEILMRLCPKSRELSLALTALEETVMMANAAIARNE
jgi:hypothetical protein